MSVGIQLSLQDDLLLRREILRRKEEAKWIWLALTAVFWLTAGYDTWMLATKAARDVFGAGATAQTLRDADPNRDYVELFNADSAIRSAHKTMGPAKFEFAGRAVSRKVIASRPDPAFIGPILETPDEIVSAPRAAALKAGGIVEATRIANRQPLVFEIKVRSL